MLNSSQIKNLRQQECNFLKLQVQVNRFPMATQSALVSKNASKALKRSSSHHVGSSSRMNYPSVAFAKATENMVEDGVTILASISDTNLAPEVECMAAEFQQAIVGDIESVVSPFEIKLKNKENTTKVKMGNLLTIVSNLVGKQFPYYRVDRLKILYLPLFSSELAENEKITFSIRDSSIRIGSKVIAKAEAPLNKMSMVELFSSYFVDRKNLGVMEFGYKAKNVPITGRAFGFVCLSFYIQKDFIPTTIKRRNPIVLLIEDLDCPVDITKKSSISTLVNKVNNRIAENRNTMERHREREDNIEEERLSNLLFTEKTERPQSVDSGFHENPEGMIKKEDIVHFLPRKLPFWEENRIILDTGAPDHWFYHPSLLGLSSISNSDDDLIEGKNFHRLEGVEVKLGVHWVRLQEVLYGRKASFPLISYGRLYEGGIVNQLVSLPGRRAQLCLNDKVIFSLTHDGSYYVFDSSESLSCDVLVEKREIEE
uniref:Movement protein n=1 Tax=pepper chlorosis associated virus TaxID=2966369 RepID=A0AA96TBY4_9VIRU|nr:movement protein [pepper chlorosis associated virus]